MTEIGESVTLPELGAHRDATGTAEIQVVNPCDGKGIENADVSLGRRRVKTDGSGNATFPSIEAGSHVITVAKEFPQADYLVFVVHYPKISLDRKARSEGSGSVMVPDGGNGSLRVELTVYRVVEAVTIRRNHIQLDGEDKYGHWWIELGPAESYGWWPGEPLQEPLGAPPPTPEPGAGIVARIQYRFDAAIYAARSAYAPLRPLARTLGGVKGDLNGQALFGGTSTQDPHHIVGDQGHEAYEVVLADCRTDETLKGCLRAFAHSYEGSWAWRGEGSWSLPVGRNCHTFQKQMLDRCEIDMYHQVR